MKWHMEIKGGMQQKYELPQRTKGHTRIWVFLWKRKVREAHDTYASSGLLFWWLKLCLASTEMARAIAWRTNWTSMVKTITVYTYCRSLSTSQPVTLHPSPSVYIIHMYSGESQGMLRLQASSVREQVGLPANPYSCNILSVTPRGIVQCCIQEISSTQGLLSEKI